MIKFGIAGAAAGLAAALALATTATAAERTPAPEGASVRIISPQDGATVTNPVTVVFGVTGMGVAPAGVERKNTGHHHLLINSDLPPLDEAVPASTTSLHFGGGQTEVTLDLPAGETKLQLLFGDHLHIPHNPPLYSEAVTVTVE